MPSLREQDIEKIAERIVTRCIGGQEKLANVAAQEAMQGSLNPDQIERMSQAANTMMFLRMMENQKAQGGGDLTHEFDPIDARQVIQQLIQQAPGGMGAPIMEGNEMHGGMPPEMMGHGGQPQMGHDGPPPMHDEMEIPDEMGGEHINPAEGAPGHEDSPEVEQCEEDCHAKKDPPGTKTEKKDGPGFVGDKAKKKETKSTGDDEPAEKEESPKKKEARLINMRKLADVLDDQFRQAEWTFDETYAALNEHLKRQSKVAFDEFQTDVLIEHGSKVGMAVLNALRAERGLPALEALGAEKTASFADRHITKETPALSMFENLVKAATDAERLQSGVKILRERCS